ncbi:serine/threonine-protein kinase [Candidatus Uabimicrobium amorphum]|uniref:non-specific serine/threonine protein kinase n=1 Tax=Uabimicrobium amorphum TaxID=2596890 RepID=A0A5S9IT27_UABAM|nr:serine/threonine-protein kinase [Candidatus Uabimicrobium amorphum]BBM86125.1 serine/threonine protein kinase [Candidatus Uabimicrobium amorphum]
MKLLNKRYKIQKVFGQGGMGRVYLAEDIQTQEMVAVKECIVHGKDPEQTIRRIQREYFFLTKLEHPNLVKALDIFCWRNNYYLVMECIAGITLSQFIREKPNSIDFTKQLEIAKQLCSVVAAINQQGVIHRDLKPSNIILQGDNLTPRLLDLGIAKSINRELATITNMESIVGTPSYMSPEQIDHRLKVEKNTDVFCLGVVLYQFFSWLPQSPFYAGSAIATLDKIVHLELPPLFSDTSDIQYLRVSGMISLALRKSCEDRLDSADTMLEMLRGSAEIDGEQTKDEPVVAKNYMGVIVALIVFVISFGLYHYFYQVYPTVQHNKLYEAQYKKAIIYEEQKDFAKAIEEYTKLLEMKSSSHVYKKIGDCYLESRNYARAIENWQSALSLETNLAMKEDLEIATEVAFFVIYKDSQKTSYNDIQKARKLFDQAIDYGTQKKYGESLALLQEVVSLYPKAIDTYYAKAQLHYRLRQYKQAIISIKNFIQLKPQDDRNAYGLQGLCYFSLARYTQALSYYNKAIEANPDRAENYNNRGYLYATLGQYEKALVDCHKAIYIDSAQQQFHNSLAFIYNNLGFYERATQEVEISLKINPNNAIAYLHKAVSNYQLGKRNKALEYFQRAAKSMSHSELQKRYKVHKNSKLNDSNERMWRFFPRSEVDGYSEKNFER